VDMFLFKSLSMKYVPFEIAKQKHRSLLGMLTCLLVGLINNYSELA
jgi:hypothetical protein